MKQQSSSQPRKGLSKRIRTIGMVVVGLFLACCILTFVLANISENQQKTKDNAIPSTQAVSVLPSPTFANTAAFVYTATSTAAPTHTTAPTETNVPVPAQAPTRLSDCLPENARVEKAKVVRIVDGDTIDVTIDGSAFTVRYIGIDTPETKDPNSPIQFYGPEAANRNTEFVANKEVLLVKDTSETDSFSRLLRYVFVDGIFVNESLVKEGYAHAKAYPPDTSCHALFTKAEGEAKAHTVGLWSSSATKVEVIPTPAPTLPPVTSSEGCPQGCVEQKPGCDIKGNINSSGDMIYHAPGSSSYSKTKIDPANGERWFCTAEEAVANGWRAPRN